MPHFQELANKYKSSGVSLLLVSLDMKESFPSKVVGLMKKLKISSPGVWLNETDADYFCPKIDSNWSGALPSSLFVNNKTGYRRFYEEEFTREALEKEIQSLIATKKD
jgi:hypothetical protein